MPTVPIADNLVQRRAPDQNRFITPETGAVGAAIGRGLQNLAGATADYADEQQRVHEQLAEASGKDADNTGVAKANDLLYTGADPFMGKRGKDALMARPAIDDSLKAIAKEVIESAKDPLARRMLSDVWGRRLNEYSRTVADYATGQVHEYDVGETTGHLGTALASAGNHYLDPKASEADIATVRADSARLASLKGWGPDETTAYTQQHVSGARKDIAVRLAYEGGRGPDVAQAYLDQHAGDFTGDDAATVSTHIRTQQDHIVALQRTAAAEARRQDREQKSDLSDQAEDALRILGTGTPLPPRQVASAVDAANKAGKPGLAFSLATASFKNGLNVQYRSATPGEIGTRTDTLGAEIAKAGDHPDPQSVIEYNHLRQIQSASAADLKNDPLSWGASHLGIDAGPIDWKDPGSIGARLKAANTVAARTGTTPRYLTGEEAAQFAPVAATGTVQQKSDLIRRLALLGGNAGTAAARQIAPNDPAFGNIVGLATGSRRDVAAAQVSAALGGSEAIKAHPKLMDGQAIKATQQDFERMGGGAFRLLPQASAGVLQTARYIFAARVSQQGFTDYASARQGWNGAVNAALGAYLDGGVQRGGIGTHAGAVTILPDNVTQDEFDKKLARSAAPALVSAANGHPVWANGQALYSGDVKSAQFVPIGSGRYALFANGAFVQRKEGGKFILDYSRLP